MISFIGKVTNEEKSYFNELHLTLLWLFQGLFDDLDGNLKKHLQTFETKVDVSDTAVIESHYLQNVKEDINEVYEKLEKQDEIIHDTIEEVSDISSATSPVFSDVHEWKKKSVEEFEKVKKAKESVLKQSEIKLIQI